MEDKKALGRGLGALIPGAPPPDMERADVPLHLIDPNPYQPRQYWDDGQLEELAASLKEHGLVQPVVLRKFGDRYQLVAGERRWRAAKKAGFQRIPAVVRSYEDKAMLELALIENLQRQNLNPIETARAYRRLIDEYSYTQEDLGKRMGRSRSAIANTLRLLALADPVQEMLASGALTEGQARPLLAEPPEIQEAMASDIANRGLTARQVERMTSRRVVSRETSSVIDPHRADAIERLQHRLGTAVRISGADKGELAIRFYSLDDLNRVIDLILNTEEGLN